MNNYRVYLNMNESVNYETIEKREKPKYLKLQRKKHCTTWSYHGSILIPLGWAKILLIHIYNIHEKHKNQEN